MEFGPKESKRFQIETLLADEISDGRYGPSDRFPSERSLAVKYGVSRQTIRIVIMSLQRRGLVYRRQGKGTFVSPPSAGKSARIGLLVSGGRYTEIFRSICAGLAEIARERRIGLETADVSGSDPDAIASAAERAAKDFVKRGFSGVVFQPLQFSAEAKKVNRRIANRLAAAGVPVVLIDCDIESFPERSVYDLVGINNFEAGLRVGRHLAEAGTRRVGFLVDAGFADSVRFRMFGAAGVLRGRFAGEIQVAPGDGPVAIAQELKAHPGLDALICQNDLMAIRAIEALGTMGMKVPEDVLVAGFDDVGAAAAAHLTSVRQPCRQIAQAAFQRLLARMKSPDLAPAEVFLDAPLVRRESTRATRA